MHAALGPPAHWHLQTHRLKCEPCLGGEKVMSEETSSTVECEHALQYAVHDGISLAGDFYRPAVATNAPVVVAVHGGAWKVGDASDFQCWGPWLASRGIAVYSIEYRLVPGEQNRYPAAVFDVRAAVQFVR